MQTDTLTALPASHWCRLLRGWMGPVLPLLAAASPTLAEAASLTGVRPPTGHTDTTMRAPATLAHGPSVATVTPLAACNAGQLLRFDLTLRQDGALGQRRGTTACSNGLARHAMALPGQGPAGFAEAAGLVEADARIVERGLVVDTKRWSRRVQLRTAP